MKEPMVTKNLSSLAAEFVYSAALAATAVAATKCSEVEVQTTPQLSLEEIKKIQDSFDFITISRLVFDQETKSQGSKRDGFEALAIEAARKVAVMARAAGPDMVAVVAEQIPKCLRYPIGQVDAKQVMPEVIDLIAS